MLRRIPHLHNSKNLLQEAGLIRIFTKEAHSQSSGVIIMDGRHQELLTALQPTVADVTRQHVASQNLWMPSELLPKGFETQAISEATAAMLTMNLLTEDGLPYFLSLLVHHLGDEGALFEWSRVWTSEEDRHGAAIKLYLREALPQEQFLAVERMQHSYLTDGFWPKWENSPIRLIAYVVLQERATQLSHAGIAKRAKHEDPVLQKMLGRISAEEHRHHLVYFAFFERLFELDPTECLQALSKVVGTFEMPGHQMPAFSEIAYLQARLGVFGPRELADIITDVWKKLTIDTVSNLNESGERARDTLAKQIKTLYRVADRMDKQAPRTVDLSLLGIPSIVV